MELSKENIISIFKNNFKCEVIETDLGKGFKLNPYQAFIFCSITGSGYLDNPIMPPAFIVLLLAFSGFTPFKIKLSLLFFLYNGLCPGVTYF